VGEEAQRGGDWEAALVAKQLPNGDDMLRMVECSQGLTQGWRMRGREGAMATSGGGRVGGEGGASQRRFPGGVDPREDSDGRCGCLALKSVNRDEFKVGWVAKRAGGGARR